MIRVPVVEVPSGVRLTTHRERVRFGDTDAAGIVYYANYLKWFEAGRSELMRDFGLPYADLVEGGLYLPVVEAWCRYVQSARYDDEIEVLSWVHEIRHATLLVAHQIIRVSDRAMLAHGAARLGCVSAAGRPQRLPERLFEALALAQADVVEEPL